MPRVTASQFPRIMSQLEFQWIDRARFSDDAMFRVRDGYPDALHASLSEREVKTPLLVQSVGDHVRVVSGWGRLVLSNSQSLPCFLLDGGSTTLELWQKFVDDNDRWNAIEVARLIDRLHREGVSDGDVAREWFPRLGLRPAKELCATYRRLLELPPTVRDFVAEHDLPVRRARQFLRLSTDAATALLEEIARLRLSASETSSVIELVEEVAHRDSLDAFDVVRQTLTGEKTKALALARLRDRRFPELAKFREQLEAEQKALEFSVPVRVEWDRELARPGLRLTAELSDSDALTTYEREIAENRGRLEALFSIL